MSIRVRLTLWYTTVLAGILLILGLTIYRTFVASLDSEINRTLDQVALDLQGAYTGEQPFFFGGQRIVVPRLNTFSLSSIYVQVWDVAGHLQARSDNVAAYPLPLDPQAVEHQVSQRRIADVTVRDSDARLRVLTIPLLTPEQRLVGWIQIGTSADTLYSARRQLLLTLLRGSLVGVLLAALMGALLARRALRPIHTITQTALQITRADDLDRRIVHTGPPDEVGQLADAFNEMLERLERIFIAQRRFVADVSHELRTPLTTIRGNADLLRRMGCTDSASLDAILSESDRMIRMVNDLLMLARADAGYLPVSREPVAIDALLVEIAHQARVLAGERLTVALECPALPDKEPLIVMGDADRLRQLVLNLVDNAIKHTPDGGRVSLCLTRQQEWVCLSVTDTGEGIPPQDLPYIFDRFYRAEKSRARQSTTPGASRGSGAGLGLSIAQWIAHAHGGYIEVESQEGQGSTFRVWLPLAPPAAESP